MQLGRFGLGVELHAGNDRAGVNGLSDEPASIGLERAVLAFFLTEDAGGGECQLHDVAFDIAGKHHRQTLLIPAGAALSITGTGDVLRALGAGIGLRRSRLGIGLVAVIAPAVRTGNRLAVIRLHVEGTRNLGRSLDDHDIHIALVDSRDFLAASHEAEHTALDRDALAACRIASESLGNIRQHARAGEGGDLGRIKNRHVAHLLPLGWLAYRNLILRIGVEPGRYDPRVVFQKLLHVGLVDTLLIQIERVLFDHELLERVPIGGVVPRLDAHHYRALRGLDRSRSQRLHLVLHGVLQRLLLLFQHLNLSVIRLGKRLDLAADASVNLRQLVQRNDFFRHLLLLVIV